MLASIHHKINLGLQVIEKLSTRYHALETVFYPCFSYEDTIEISLSDHFTFTIKDADFICDVEQNLCVKAYRLLQKRYPLPPVHIALTKRIPSGAGLGGGSADAALTLKMLNRIFSLQLSTNQLHDYAVLLGSDVAFFLYDKPMYATGRGEILEPIALDLSKYKIELVCSDISVSTARAYRAITPQIPKIPLREIVTAPIETWRENLINDFEKVIFKQHPQLAAIKEELYRRCALYASMSGSGSAVYGIFPN